MCGRFALHTPATKIEEVFHLPDNSALELKPRYNIAPSQDVPVIRDTDTEREMVMARWGLIPTWSKEAKSKYSTINARIESVAEKPTYRTPFKRRRCLIPADGFYEWKMVNSQKVPHHIRMRDSSVFAFAGLWDHWEDENESLDSCVIITTPSNEAMKPIHERMPAIIAPAHYDLWLDSRVSDKQEIMQYLASAPSSQLTAYPVSTWVNSPRNNDERCIQPAGV
ncbi:SOS response-associated peptidase [Gammaproteobacteria bacterium]|nr:SOS response-associated peptidase [Gammaproteobacteria bacterium]